MLALIMRVMLVATGLWALPASAGPALLFEAGSGTVLYAEDQDNQWHPGLPDQDYDGLRRLRRHKGRQNHVG